VKNNRPQGKTGFEKLEELVSALEMNQQNFKERLERLEQLFETAADKPQIDTNV